MEDILASIRKIIAEDPSPTKTVPNAPTAGMTLSAAVATARNAVPVGAPQPSIIPQRTSMPPVPVQAAAETASTTPASRLSDVMRELAPGAVPVSGNMTASFHDDLSDLVDGESDAAGAVSARAAPLPVSPPIRPAAESSRPTSHAVAPPMADLPAAPALRSPETIRHADLGAFIPSTAEPIGMTSPRATALSVGADLRDSRDSQADQEVAEPLARRPLDLASAFGDARELASKIEPVAAQPAATVEGTVDTETVGDPVAAAQTALGALAMGFATPSAPSVPAASVAAQTAVAIATPTPTIAGAEAPLAERRSLDDTIVDMLRPMIRDWLDDHLPEMVGKALHQELNDRRGRDS